MILKSYYIIYKKYIYTGKKKDRERGEERKRVCVPGYSHFKERKF